MDNPEHDLLRQAQQGDYDAFTTLYESLYPAVWRFVLRLIGDSDDAEDITQLTFIALYRNLNRIDPVQNLRPYVFKIARNRCTDELRRQGRYSITSIDDDETLPPVRISFTANAEKPPDEAVHWLLIQMEVVAAIDQLPEHHRQTLILYAEEHLSLAEIAIVMDTSIGTVKSRLHHARKSLRGLLNPQTLQSVETLFISHEHDTGQKNAS